MTRDTWNADRLKFLRANWGTLTSQEIANVLGHGITRCSVLGKAHREKLPPSPFNKNPAIKKAKPEIEIIEEPAPGILMTELTENTCRWPQGDPKKPGFNFCGKHVARDSVYCQRHSDLGLASRQGQLYYKDYEYKNRTDVIVDLTEAVK